jgi:hypothetical protein|tara:strand:+ start:769 stop:1026 length:258 start_codon:yes stop_codon:yes gene_type:complete
MKHLPNRLTSIAEELEETRRDIEVELIYAELYFYISGKYKEVKTDFKGHPITTLLKELMETLEKTPADPMEQEESWLQPFEYGSN